MIRRLFVAASLLAILAAGAVGVRAADTLGATVGTLPGWPYVRLTAQSALAESFTLEPPAGWQLATTAVTLAPGESRDVPVTVAGPDGTLAVHVAAAVPVAGNVAGAIVLQADLKAHAPLEVPWTALAILALCALLAVRPLSRLARRRR